MNSESQIGGGSCPGFRSQQITRQQVAAIAPHDVREQNDQIRGQRQGQGQLERQAEHPVEQVQRIRYQVDAQRIEDVIGVQRGLAQVEQAELEPPQIPNESVLVEGPRRAADGARGEMRRQRPRQSQRQQRIQGEHKDMGIVSFPDRITFHFCII